MYLTNQQVNIFFFQEFDIMQLFSVNTLLIFTRLDLTSFKGSLFFFHRKQSLAKQTNKKHTYVFTLLSAIRIQVFIQKIGTTYINKIKEVCTRVLHNILAIRRSRHISIAHQCEELFKKKKKILIKLLAHMFMHIKEHFTL